MSRFPIKGYVRIKQIRCGKVIFEDEGENLVVSAGRTLVRDLFNETGSRISHAAIGSDGTAVAASDTALGAEIAIARQALIGPFIFGPYSSRWLVSITNSTGVQQTVNEFGLFNAAVAGTMLSRFLSQEFLMEDGDVVALSWEITFGD